MLLHGPEDAGEFLLDQPEDASLLDALQGLIQSQLSSEKLEQLRAVVSLCREYATLQPHVLEAVMLSRQTAVAAFTEFAAGRYSRQYVITLIGVAYGALALIFDGSLDLATPGQEQTSGSRSRSENGSGNGSGAVTFEEFLDTTFKYLRTGF